MKKFNPSEKPALSTHGAALDSRIHDKSAVIGVVGLGYVGLPIALEFALNGYQVIGVDVDAQKIDALTRAENYIEDLKDEEVSRVVRSGHLRSYVSFEALAQADVIYICVPTPFNDNKDPDLTYIEDSARGIARFFKDGCLVILKSTTFPGTTEWNVIPILEKSGKVCGKDFFAAFSPERVDPGNKVYHTFNTPIVTGGVGEEASYLAALANQKIIETVYMVSNPKVAELEKLLENIFRSVNIALVNELALLCERIGDINVWEVIEAASTKPFGYMKFLPGPGVGGHCIPIDPYYLSWLARAYDFETKFITLAANVNESMPYHVANKVIREIANVGIRLADARILIVGASFKKNVKDLRHSPSEMIIKRLRAEGFRHIDYTDPWVPVYDIHTEVLHSVPSTVEQVKQYDVTVLVTDHDDFNIAEIVAHSKIVIDTRYMTRDIKGHDDKIRLLGYTPAEQ